MSDWFQGPEVRVIWRVNLTLQKLWFQASVKGAVYEVLICQGISSYKERTFIRGTKGGLITIYIISGNRGNLVSIY